MLIMHVRGRNFSFTLSNSDLFFVLSCMRHSISFFRVLFLLPFCWVGLLWTTGCGRMGASGKEGDVLVQVREAIRVSDFGDASDLLEAALERGDLPEEREVEARYLAGISAWHRVPPTQEWETKASEHLQIVVDAEGEHPKQAQAAYTLGRIAEVMDYPGDESRESEAREWYQRTRDQWPDSHAAHFAIFRLAAMDINAFEDPERVRKGCQQLEQWVVDHEGHDMIRVAASFLAKSYDIVLQEPEQALKWYLMGEEIGLVSQTKESDNRWRIAEIAEQLENWPLAVKMYQTIIVENPLRGRAYVSQLWLKELQKQYPELEIQIPRVPNLNELGGDS